MAFTASDHKVADWTANDGSGRLTKVVSTFNSENLVATRYKTLPILGVGDPSLYITYIYDAKGNILAENKEVREWTATQETSYTGDSDPSVDVPATETSITGTVVVSAISANVSIDDSTPISTSGTIAGVVSTNATIQGTPNVAVTGNVAIDDSTPIDTAVTGTVTANSTIQNATLAVTKSGTWAVDSVGGTVTTNATIQNATLATKGKTSYSDTTTDVNYWLGLYNDNQLIKKSATVSSTEITTTATFQSTAVDAVNSAIQINEFLDGSGNVTGRSAQVVTWTQANEDLSLPSITSIALGLPSSIVTGSVEDVAIGTLSAVGATGAITWSIEDAGGLDTIKLVGAIMKSGSGGITDTAGTFTVSVKAVDSIGKERTSNVTVTVESSYSNTKYIDTGSFGRWSVIAQDIAGEVDISNVVIRSDKNWTVNMWVKSSGSWITDRWLWGMARQGRVFGTSIATPYFGISIEISGDGNIYMRDRSNGFDYAVFGSALSTSAWHMVTVTNVAAASLGGAWNWDIDEDASYTRGITVYIDGVRRARTAGPTGADGYHSTTDSTGATADEYEFRTGFGMDSWYALDYFWDELSIHNTTKSAVEVGNMYNSGSSTDLSSDTSAKVWIKADDLATGASEIGNGDIIANAGGDYPCIVEAVDTPDVGLTAGTVVEY
jgi:hypothetical protein